MPDLIQKAINGDAEAFLELMDKHSLAMYKVAIGILKNDDYAADAIQDTILTCFEKLHTLQKPEYFKTWLIRILINECRQILAHYRKIEFSGTEREIPQQDMSLAEFEFKEMLEMTDEKYREVLILYYVEGFKISEISILLGMNENTVKTRLTRAREQIKAFYSETTSKKGGQADGQKGMDRRDNRQKNRRDIKQGISSSGTGGTGKESGI